MNEVTKKPISMQAQNAANRIFLNLDDRSGVLDGVDDGVRAEILTDMVQIIDNAYAADQAPPPGSVSYLLEDASVSALAGAAVGSSMEHEVKSIPDGLVSVLDPAADKKLVYIVARKTPPSWALLGIYLSEGEASKACKHKDDFYSAVKVGSTLPASVETYEGATYPAHGGQRGSFDWTQFASDESYRIVEVHKEKIAIRPCSADAFDFGLVEVYDMDDILTYVPDLYLFTDPVGNSWAPQIGQILTNGDPRRFNRPQKG